LGRLGIDIKAPWKKRAAGTESRWLTTVLEAESAALRQKQQQNQEYRGLSGALRTLWSPFRGATRLVYLLTSTARGRVVKAWPASGENTSFGRREEQWDRIRMG
jgi:hypothetical protein